ncbi:hypothetical protein GCM10010404_81240 [Nonomuraea africana]|uniref:Uncharacterized protein n=1 Tax=Nonomuraea africana TaxID=46171 RepID=A0ABR9KWT3_9ACTN|nr:hypothetical protein [Nonomuraea africana]MBE1566498.1 hypothetical protein [Nonomuraea africana]
MSAADWQYPGEPTELKHLVDALSTGLERVGWTVRLPSSEITISGNAWASEADERQGGSVARRSLYEVAEQAIATVDALGWKHSDQPAIDISPADPAPTWEQQRRRYLLRMTFRLRPWTA